MKEKRSSSKGMVPRSDSEVIGCIFGRVSACVWTQLLCRFVFVFPCRVTQMLHSCAKPLCLSMLRSHSRIAHFFRYCSSNFFGKGSAVANFVMDMGTALWLSKKMDPATRFHNGWVAYFLEQFLTLDAHARHKGNESA